jgi:predicted amidohydrolase
MKIKVAAVSTESYYGQEEYKNAYRALKYMEEAVALGAELVAFPEGYPGPCHGPLDSGGKLPFKPMDALREKARECGVYVTASDLEENPEIADTFYLTHKLISPEGEISANYKRVQPDHQDLNAFLMGGRRHILPGDEITVAETKLGNMGLQICSELFVPEISRVQMLKGADLIVAPVNGVHRDTQFRLKQTWRSIAHARAAENLLFVIMPENVFLVNGRLYALNVGCIVGPEGFLAMAEGPGIMVATLDMDRLNWLRTRYVEEELLHPPKNPDNFQPIKARPGQNHDRRPELYRLLAQPQTDAFDYFYFKEGIESWPENYHRVRKQPRPGKSLP